MSTEIERKFQVTSNGWHTGVDEATAMRQGYFETSDDSTVRVRLVERLDDVEQAIRLESSQFDDLASDSNDTSEAWLTIKGPPDDGEEEGLVRPEFEYAVPPDEAARMLELFCGDRQVHKIRYYGRFRGWDWVIDRFGGANAGLVLAEVELDSPEAEVDPPDWIGRELTGDRAWSNAALARRPYRMRGVDAAGASSGTS
jgi:adenylate cyclase